MKEGFYSIAFTGQTGDSGFGIFALDTSNVIGADVTGARYDGTYAYNQQTELIDADITLTVPPGVPLVQGVPARPEEWSFNFTASFPSEAKETPVGVDTPYGPVNTIIRFLRAFKD